MNLLLLIIDNDILCLIVRFVDMKTKENSNYISKDAKMDSIA